MHCQMQKVRHVGKLFYDHIFIQQFIYVAKMGEKENELWLERNNQNISSNYYLWVVGF